MSFTNRLRQLAKSIWDAQYVHPFVVALGKGTLPERKFKYYILQDARFLGDLSRVFAAGALRAPDSDSALRFAKLAEETITVERSLHENYGKRWKMTAKEMSSVPMAPTNYAYTRHMLTVAHTGSAAEITVVALPCAWIYCVVGQHLLEHGPPKRQSSLSGLAYALRLTGVCRSTGMDAQESGPVGQDSRQGRKATDGRIVRHQLAVRVDVLGDGVEGGRVAGVRGAGPGAGRTLKTN